MAKVFIGISAAFMLATAVVSFLLKGKIDTLQQGRKDAVARITNAEGREKNAQKEAEKAKQEAAEANKQLEGATQQATTASQAAEEAKKHAAELQVLVEQQKKQIEDAANNPKTPGGPTPQEFAALQQQLQDATAKADAASKEASEAKAVADTQTAKVASMTEHLSELEKKERQREGMVEKTGLRARVLAVNAGWNFVVLSVGDKQSVRVDDPLIVIRGSEPVARLRITSVEPSTSIADVIPGTVRHGVTVQPGDTVIFQGRTPATSPDSIKSSGAPSGGTTTPTTPPN